MGKQPSREAPSFRIRKERSKGAVERWSGIVVSRQGVNRGNDFEVRRRGALPSYAIGQGVSDPSEPDLPNAAARAAEKCRARMDAYLRSEAHASVALHPHHFGQ
jgi:hypothetical protein